MRFLERQIRAKSTHGPMLFCSRSSCFVLSDSQINVVRPVDVSIDLTFRMEIGDQKAMKFLTRAGYH